MVMLFCRDKVKFIFLEVLVAWYRCVAFYDRYPRIGCLEIWPGTRFLLCMFSSGCPVSGGGWRGPIWCCSRPSGGIVKLLSKTWKCSTTYTKHAICARAAFDFKKIHSGVQRRAIIWTRVWRCTGAYAPKFGTWANSKYRGPRFLLHDVSLYLVWIKVCAMQM